MPGGKDTAHERNLMSKLRIHVWILGVLSRKMLAVLLMCTECYPTALNCVMVLVDDLITRGPTETILLEFHHCSQTLYLLEPICLGGVCNSTFPENLHN